MVNTIVCFLYFCHHLQKNVPGFTMGFLKSEPAILPAQTLKALCHVAKPDMGDNIQWRRPALVCSRLAPLIPLGVINIVVVCLINTRPRQTFSLQSRMLSMEGGRRKVFQGRGDGEQRVGKGRQSQNQFNQSCSWAALSCSGLHHHLRWHRSTQLHWECCVSTCVRLMHRQPEACTAYSAST